MVMERLDLLIDRIRRYTATQSYTDSATGTAQVGIQTQMLVDLFNEAQHSCHGLIFANSPALFVKSATQDLVSGTESYTIPTDAFLGRNLIDVAVRQGTTDPYISLIKRDPKFRYDVANGVPSWYIQHNKNILLNPVPNVNVTSGLRLTYEFSLPELDVRRGKISAIGGTSTNPTSITCTSKTLLDLAFAGTADPEYITIVDHLGNIKMDNIRVSAYDSGTGVLTTSVTADAGESIAVNDFVVIGDYATTTSFLPEFCELYLTKYVEHAIMELLGHPSAGMIMSQLQAAAQLLTVTFAEYNSDITEIPLHDGSRIIDFGGF